MNHMGLNGSRISTNCFRPKSEESEKFFSRVEATSVQLLDKLVDEIDLLGSCIDPEEDDVPRRNTARGAPLQKISNGSERLVLFSRQHSEVSCRVCRVVRR